MEWEMMGWEGSTTGIPLMMRRVCMEVRFISLG